MRARIATIVALLGIVGLGAAPAFAVEECPLHEQLLEQCPPPAPPPPPPPSPEPQPAPEVPPAAVPPGLQPAAATRLLTLLNAERQQRGLTGFTLREDISVQSRAHSEAMAARGTIWHNDAFFTAANKRRLGAVLLGENVARNVDIDDAHRRLMNSPGHRANVVDRRFSMVGLGVYRSATGSLYVTESFLQPVAASSPKPAPAEQPRVAPTPEPAPTTTTTLAPAPEPEPVVLAVGPAAAGAPAAVRQASSHRPSPVLQLVAVALLLACGALFAPFLSRIRR